MIICIHTQYCSLVGRYLTPWSCSIPPPQPPAVVGAHMWSQLLHRSPGHRSGNSAAQDGIETSIHAYLHRLAPLSSPLEMATTEVKSGGGGGGRTRKRWECRKVEGAQETQDSCWWGTAAKMCLSQTWRIHPLFIIVDLEGYRRKNRLETAKQWKPRMWIFHTHSESNMIYMLADRITARAR